MLARELVEDIATEHIRKLVRSRLLDADAISLDGLASYVGQDQEAVARVVDTLVADGEIELLRPVGDATANTTCPAEGVFCRMIRETDRDFIWEKEVNTRPVKNEHQEIKKVWLRMLGHGEEPDASAVRLVQTMNLA